MHYIFLNRIYILYCDNIYIKAKTLMLNIKGIAMGQVKEGVA